MTVPTITDDLVAELQSELGQILRIADSVGGACNLSAVGIGNYLRLAGPSTVLALLEANRKLRSERAELKRRIETPNITAAAKKLAECMDYPWDFMPVQGRNAMYEHAKAVIAAAMQEQPS